MLLIGFVGIAVFSFALTDHSMTHRSDSGCIFSAVTGTACPPDQANMLAHHGIAFQIFSTAIVPSLNAGSFIALLLAMAFSLFFGKSQHLAPNLFLYRTWKWANGYSPYNFRLIRSLALFEHSPSF